MGLSATNSTAAAKASQADLQADWLPVSRPPPKLVSLGGAYSTHRRTSAAYSAASTPYIASRGGAIRYASASPSAIPAPSDR